VLVSEIYNDVEQITAFTDQTTNFGRITDATEVLSNKGQFDCLLAYLDIPIQSQNIVTLPREVEVPIKVNVDNTPSFSRDRIYEFTLNGPGSLTQRADFSWEDRGNVPVMLQPATPMQLKATSSSGADVALTLTITGLDNDPANLGNVVTEIITLNGTPSTHTFQSVSHISKDLTAGMIAFKASDNTVLSNYYPDETEPSYRQIRLSKTGVTAHILFRRNRFIVRAMTDFIPIHSKMGLLYMIKSLEAYRRNDPTTGKALGDQAVELATELQKGRNSFIELAAQTEVDSARNLNINNRDSIIVSDIYDDACQIVGKVGEKNVYDSITEAIEVLDSKSLWDGTEGMVDILTDQFYYLTLPRYVDVPVQINISGEPAEMKNKWFEFHLNGPGSNMQVLTGWADMGEVVTFRDVNFPIQLIAVPDLTSDNGTVITVFGYYQGKRIQTLNVATGAMVDGFPVTCSNSVQIPAQTAQFVDRIERITKAQSNGFINLLGYDAGRNVSVPIGYYWPDETEPNYRRIKLSQPSTWVRMRYRKRTLKVSALTDPIHLKSRISIITMMRSLQALRQPQGAQEAAALEMKAVDFLNQEQMRRNPGATFSMQFGSNMGADPIGNLV
jgi:hypothetical protein